MSAPMPRATRQREAGAGSASLPGLEPWLQRIFAARGVRGPAELETALEGLLPVGSLDGVDVAAALLRKHRAGRVLVVGDFDVDGATSTAAMIRALRSWGFAHADFIVPDRFRFGYGLSRGIVELAAAQQPTLLVTVDNGISSLEGVARARELGIEVLITDHHLPGSALPAATVIVNPNLTGSPFGSHALAGVGVAFYVLAALRRLLQEQGELPAKALPVAELLDLVALGTVADLVPLDANNRILVAQGLRRIRAGRCVAGIRALLAAGQRDPARLVASDLGFTVAPRLNAAGRLEDMGLGIRCLLTDSDEEAARMAGELDVLNRQRRQIEGEMQVKALAAVSRIDPADRGLKHAGVCLFDPGWHQGVVGLVASRVKDRIHRPVIAFAPAEGELLRGSARSVPGVHIRDVLDAVATRQPGLVEKFGGHAMAAGLTLRADRLDEFARAFEAEVAAWSQGLDDPSTIWTDGALPEELLNLATARRLREAAPWGQGFPEPNFEGDFDIESARVVGERHVKFWVRPAGSSLRLDAIAFNLLEAGQEPPPRGRRRFVYRLDVNHWQGEARLQLLVDHVLVESGG